MEENVKKKHSKLSVAALIFSFLGYLGIVGVVIGICDIISDDSKVKMHKHTLSVVAIIIGLLMSLFTYGGKLSGSSDDSSETTSNETEIVETVEENDEVETSTEETTEENEDVEETETDTSDFSSNSKDSFVASCSDLKENYKSILRNPSDYEGNNYSITCYISDVRESWGTKYYIAYYIDLDEAQQKVDDGWYDSIEEALEYGYDMDYSVWLFDDRNEDSDDYVKILDGDIVTIYGTFTGTTESKNSLTRETGEEMSLHIKYADLLFE